MKRAKKRKFRNDHAFTFFTIVPPSWEIDLIGSGTMLLVDPASLRSGVLVTIDGLTPIKL